MGWGLSILVRGKPAARHWVALIFVLGLLSVASQTPVQAACAISGSTINCTGTETSPVGDGSQDGFTVDIQSGATVDVSGTPGATAVDLNNANVVTNAGTVISGDESLGINVNNGNQVTNTGNIIVGNGSTGINSCCDNTILNYGTITTGANGILGAYGISVTNNSTVANFNTISVGAGAYGIYADGGGGSPQKTITNIGTINAPGGFGIGAREDYAVVNSGTISVGNGTGIQVGGGNTVTNSGTINVSGGGRGVYLNGLASGAGGNMFFNTGSVLATGQTFAIFGVSDNTIVNTGVLQGAVVLTGSNNILTNRGYMIGADLALGVQSGGQIGGTLINDPTGTIAIRTTPLFSDNYVADTITLNGGRLHMVVMAGLYNPTTTYTPIGNCGCIAFSGTFDTVTSSSPFFTAAADYSSGTGVDVTLTRLGLGSVPGMTPNQRAVGDVLEPGYSTGLTGDLATFYGNLLAATSLDALDQLSGAGTTAAQDAALTAGGQFGNAMFQQAMNWLHGTPGGTAVTFGGSLGYASTSSGNKLAARSGYDAFAAMPPQEGTGRWRAWTNAFGGARTVDGQTGSANQTTTNFGGAFGVDRQLTPDFLFGFAAGGSGSYFSASGLSTSGSANSGHIGAYAIQRVGAGYLAATVNYARGDTTTERTITGIGATETAKGRFGSDQISGRIELGRKYGFDGYSVTPFAAIEPAVLWQHAYAESSTTSSGGPGVLGLSYQSNTVTSLPLFLGAQLNASYALQGRQTLTPFARISWVHEFKPEREIAASFVSIPAAAFTVDGARAAENAVRVEAGGTLTFNALTALFLNLTDEFSSRSHSFAALGGVKLSW